MNIERTVLSCLTCRVGIAQRGVIAPHSTKLSQCANGTDKGSSTKKPVQVKIGTKIYVVRTSTPLTKKRIRKPSASEAEDSQSEVELIFKKIEPKKNKSNTDLHATTLLKNCNKIELNAKNRNDQDSSTGPVPPPVEEEIPTHTTEGLELDSILKQPLYNKHAVKPFLPESCPKINLQGLSLTDYPFHLTSAKDVSRATSSPTSSRNLANWKESHLRKLGLDAFSEYEKDLKQDGVDFKKLVEEYLRNGDETLSAVSPVMEALWESVEPVLKDIKDPQCFRKTVIHPHLRYFSKTHCVAKYNSQPVLVDFKKTLVQRKSIHFALDDPIQLVAKLGALNFDKAWPYQIKECLLVYAYSDGSPADVHLITPKEAVVYWKIWLRKLEQFWKTFDLSSIKQDRHKLTDVAEVSATGEGISPCLEEVKSESSASRISQTCVPNVTPETLNQSYVTSSPKTRLQEAKIVDGQPEESVKKLPEDVHVHGHQTKQGSDPKVEAGTLTSFH